MMQLFAKLDPTLREALDHLHKTPIEYFKMLYVDTAMFGCTYAVRCVLEFFGRLVKIFMRRGCSIGVGRQGVLDSGCPRGSHRAGLCS